MPTREAPTIESARTRPGPVAIIAPGILVAATGVGAGDLATASFTGSHLGVAILWAVLVGAFLKFILNEGLARWQLATNSTLLEGALFHLGRPAQALFLLYLLVWTFFVASALMSACGVTAHAMLPVFADAGNGKIFFGVIHSFLGLSLVLAGGFKLFEKVMSVCIGMMFCTVVVTAILLRPDVGDVLRGVFIPAIPEVGGKGLGWTIALMGGVGGTLTVLCYGYWIREKGRTSADDLRTCRIDLATGYGLTAVFGIAMVIIGSRISLDQDGGGARLLVMLSEMLEGPIGPVGKWMFLVGAWAAVFSSLLGVWQSVPYLFADFCQISLRGRHGRARPTAAGWDLPRSLPYRLYLGAIATIPIAGLFYSFEKMQKIYALFGAAFMPLLALTLLLLNGRASLVGPTLRNGRITTFLLIATLLFFLAAGLLGIRPS